ncbi:hypothetical protein [Frondihabitans sp. PhB188]|uniref:hypothetical protein n=1 Tax=Frondihabitans sp. PhB188 TaxID=2485200 RepID=UPI0013159DE7|nr:hypothetical protein [Frondihabitans sp. PhB188]
MTRGSWLFLAAVGIVLLVTGGSLAGHGHGIIGTAIVMLGAATTGIAIGRYRSIKSPLK